MKWDRESFWHRHQKGDGECPPSLVLARELYTFSIGYYSKSKECLKFVKVLPDPCPEFTFQDDRINQKVLKKEKHVLKQDTLLLCYFQFSSVAQSCPTLCDPMNCSTPGLPVHHQPPEFTQAHVHWVGDATQPSHPLLSPSPPAPNPSQHQSLFQWVNLKGCCWIRQRHWDS